MSNLGGVWVQDMFGGVSAAEGAPGGGGSAFLKEEWAVVDQIDFWSTWFLSNLVNCV